MGADNRDRDLAYRIGDAVSSQVANTCYAIISLAITIWTWISASGDAKNILVGLETVVVIVVIGSQVWLRGAYLRLRRANAKGMSDPAYYHLMLRQVEREVTADYEDIANGRFRVFASEVPRVTVQLLHTLSELPSGSKIVRATDLTTNPQLLESRSEYLAENRRFIAAGGVIQRLFFASLEDLLDPGYAENFLALVAQHRSIGVQCGLEVRERLQPEQIVDFVVFGAGAVLIEEQQGDVEYNVGRSSVEFTGVGRWTDIFLAIWPADGVPIPVVRLKQYEAAARQLLDENAWDARRVRKALDSVD